MCVIPRGAPEETVLATSPSPGSARPARRGGQPEDAGDGLMLLVGKPVRFDLFVSDDAPTEQRPGEIVLVNDDDFERAPPLSVRFPAEAAGREEMIAVDLEGKLTSIGTLDLACVERGGDRRFHLAFQLRFDADDAPARDVSRSRRPSRGASSLSSGTRRFDEAKDAVDRAFGKPRAGATGREAKDLVRELERILGERASWNTEIARALFDALAPLARARRRSADHERVFWMLAGFCLRPGFGDPGDGARVALVAPLFAERLAFPDEARSWGQFFIAWRRVAAGLSEELQIAIRDFVDPFLAPAEAGLKKPKKPKLDPHDFDMLELAAALERVPAARRAALGGWIVERTWTERDPRLWSALGRIGARVPSYASAHHVVTPSTAERWLDHLLREKWDAIPTASRAALAMARRTGDRARDVGDRVRLEVARRLDAIGAPPDASLALREVVALSDDDRRAFFGEALPAGLRLRD
jgi:hypothetical protein